MNTYTQLRSPCCCYQ